jgi:hypothetical protein
MMGNEELEEGTHRDSVTVITWPILAIAGTTLPTATATTTIAPTVPEL